MKLDMKMLWLSINMNNIYMIKNKQKLMLKQKKFNKWIEI